MAGRELEPEAELKLHRENLLRLAGRLDSGNPALTDPQKAEEDLREAADRVPKLIRILRRRLAGSWGFAGEEEGER